jgi:hypothetical protein
VISLQAGQRCFWIDERVVIITQLAAKNSTLTPMHGRPSSLGACPLFMLKAGFGGRSSGAVFYSSIFEPKGRYKK